MVAARDELGELQLPPVRRKWWQRLGPFSWRGIPARLIAYFAELAPKGLYARTLIIIIAPIVLLESVVAFTFMERHWQAVTRRLSEATARDIAALIEVYSSFSIGDDPEPVANARGFGPSPKTALIVIGDKNKSIVKSIPVIADEDDGAARLMVALESLPSSGGLMVVDWVRG